MHPRGGSYLKLEGLSLHLSKECIQMKYDELQHTWDSTFPKLSERVKANWFAQLNCIQKATAEVEVNEAGLLAKGFAVALAEAELTDMEGLGLLGTTLMDIQEDALARIRMENSNRRP